MPFPEIKDWKTLRIRLKRTECFGACPAYTVEVRGDTDQVEFDGAGGTLVMGHHHGSISKADLQKLVAAFQRADYFSLKDRYEYLVTDNPTYRTSIEFDGLKKSVLDYVGLEAGMPEVVRELEDSIDEIIGTEKWIKGNTLTGPALVGEGWNFRAESDENRALFARVVQNGPPDLLQLFLEKGAPALAMTKDGEGALVSAAGKGDFDLVSAMLRNAATV